jgi:hypothetical protein
VIREALGETSTNHCSRTHSPLLGTGKVPYAKSEPMCTGTCFRFLTEPAEGYVTRVRSSAKDDAAATTFKITLALSAASAEETTPSI